MLAPTLKRLSMFVLRAKCKLSDASAEFALFGLAGDAAATPDAAAPPPWRRADDATAARAARLPADGQPRAAVGRTGRRGRRSGRCPR